MSAATSWSLIGLCAAVTAIIKAAGPVALGGREMPPWFLGVIQLMAPALLAALVCVSLFSDGHRHTRGVGVALWRGASVIAGVVIAAVVTALLRAL